MVTNRKTDNNLGSYSEEERLGFRFSRRAIVKKLYAQGYSNQWGFARAVAEMCMDEDVPQNAEAIQGDIKAVEKLLAEDTTTEFGRARTLEVLKGELMDLAIMKQQLVENPDDNKRLGLVNTTLKVLKQIRELEGQDAPSTIKHDHRHVVSVHHIIQRLPVDVLDKVAAARTPEELEGILTSVIGREDTLKLITAISSADEP